MIEKSAAVCDIGLMHMLRTECVIGRVEPGLPPRIGPTGIFSGAQSVHVLDGKSCYHFA